MLTTFEKETIIQNLVIMNELNTTLGDHLLYFYKNKNNDKYQGPFYFEIYDKNKSSFKVKSIDESGNTCKTYKITQVKKDGSYYQTNINNLSFTRSGGNYTVYKILLKHTSKSIIIKNPKLPSIPHVDKKQEIEEESHKEVQEEIEEEGHKEVQEEVQEEIEEEYSIFCENRLNTIKQDILLGEIKTFNNPLYHQN